MPIVSVPAVRVFRLAGAHGSGDGLGLGATAALGEAAADAATEGAADGAVDGAGVGVAAPEQAATSAPVSARATAGRNGVRMVRTSPPCRDRRECTRAGDPSGEPRGPSGNVAG